MIISTEQNLYLSNHIRAFTGKKASSQRHEKVTSFLTLHLLFCQVTEYGKADALTVAEVCEE